MMSNTEAPRRQYEFDLSQLEPFELGAAASVIMCWPDPKDEDLRGQMHAKIAAVLLRNSVGDRDEAHQTPRRMKPVYAFRNVEQDVENMARLDTRLTAALVFGHRVIPFLKHEENGSIDLLTGMDGLSLASLVRAVEEETGEAVDIANFRKRDWLPWLPVAHLAAGARIFMQLQGLDQFPLEIWWNMMTDASLVTAWLGQARLLEPIVLAAFPEVGSKLARVRLVGVNLPTTT